MDSRSSSTPSAWTRTGGRCGRTWRARRGCRWWRSSSTPPPRSAEPATRSRDRPVPAASLARQLRRMSAVGAELEGEGWDVRVVSSGRTSAVPVRWPRPQAVASHRPAGDAPGRAVPVGRGSARLAARRRAGGRRGGLRRHRADGPPDPDPAGRPRVGSDPRTVGDPRGAGRAGHRPRARDAVHAGDLPRSRHHRQGRRNARRAQRRPSLLRPRRRVVGPRARGVRPGLPADGAAPRRPRSRRRDDASPVGAGHQGVRRRAGHAARDHVLSDGPSVGCR